MKIKYSRLIVLSSGFLFILDQFLKHLFRTNTNFVSYVWEPYIGWQYFGNVGIAFGIPFPNWILIILTPLILLLLLSFYYKKKPSYLVIFGLYLIYTGALSNLVDRSLYEVTIDYFRIYTSIINLADVYIVFGALLLIFNFKKKIC